MSESKTIHLAADLSFLHTAVGALVSAAGFPALAQRFDTWGSVQERVNLDGLLALWQPSAGN